MRTNQRAKQDTPELGQIDSEHTHNQNTHSHSVYLALVSIPSLSVEVENRTHHLARVTCVRW